MRRFARIVFSAALLMLLAGCHHGYYSYSVGYGTPVYCGPPAYGYSSVYYRHHGYSKHHGHHRYRYDDDCD